MKHQPVVPGKNKWCAMTTAILVIAAFGHVAGAAAAETESAIARGGRLYDKWFTENKSAKPTGDHSAYPHKGGRYGKDTSWRCKECHGWDYRGKDGAYASGGHATGIKGINGSAGKDPAVIVAVLKDKTHGYTDKVLSAQDFNDLALFVSRGRSTRRSTSTRRRKSRKATLRRARSTSTPSARAAMASTERS